MDAIECITTRRSTRAFLYKPVSKRLIENILAAADRSPSFTNTQPWEVAVIRGAKCKDIKKILGDLAGSNMPRKPDYPYQVNWPAELAKRSLDHRTRRAHFLDQEFGDERQTRENRLANFDFYGAPCVIFLFIERTLGTYSIYDAGLFSQSIVLAAHAYGLGTCIQATLNNYPDAVRNFLSIPDTKSLLMGISIGYPDQDARINKYVSTRAGPVTFAKWYE
jgi:nitroreductase